MEECIWCGRTAGNWHVKERILYKMCIRDSGYSAEEIFSSAFYNTRPEFFFEFYKKEMLDNPPEDTASGPALAAMEMCIRDRRRPG